MSYSCAIIRLSSCRKGKKVKVSLVLLIVVFGSLVSGCQSNDGPPQATNLEDLVARLTGNGRELIEETQDFQIYWSELSQDFMVRVLTTPYQDGKQKAENWFLQQGFSQSQLCEARVHFVADKEVAPDFSFEDAVPTGCPLQIPTPPGIIPTGEGNM